MLIAEGYVDGLSILAIGCQVDRQFVVAFGYLFYWQSVTDISQTGSTIWWSHKQQYGLPWHGLRFFLVKRNNLVFHEH